MRADRLVSLVLLLQARGRITAGALAAELGVSVRTVYRDLEALSAAGVPVMAESGPGGGCELLPGYRFPLRALSRDEAEALIILGVPPALRELGLADAVTAAHRQIRVTSGLAGDEAPAGPLIHLDMPRWFTSAEPVPELRRLAEALRWGRRVDLRYRRGNGQADPAPRSVGPLGLVNKAGTWYLVAVAGEPERRTAVFRVGRIISAQVRPEPFERPAGFELAAFWADWSREFMATRPRLPVRLRASPEALAILPEVLGDYARDAIDAAEPPDEQGWRALVLCFEHERAAAHRLAGFGPLVEVLSPPAVRDLLLDTAQGILERYAPG
ncbi:MAG: helix-turn-helix transcriptional regulator [Streptosporangiaceae bacterium]